jgi:hypothetical protein
MGEVDWAKLREVSQQANRRQARIEQLTASADEAFKFAMDGLLKGDQAEVDRWLAVTQTMALLAIAKQLREKL